MHSDDYQSEITERITYHLSVADQYFDLIKAFEDFPFAFHALRVQRNKNDNQIRKIRLNV